jgi:hypothetical protein
MMGVSTDGILCYGVLIDSDDPPWTEADKKAALDDCCDVATYWVAKQLRLLYWWCGTFVDQGIEVVAHCSDEYPEFILAMHGTVTCASRGYPEAVDPAAMMTEEGRARFVETLRKLGIVDPQPQWWLCSYWG